MESTGKILTKILAQSDLDLIAPDIVTKIETYFDQRFGDFLTTKALHDNAQRKVDDQQTELDALNAQKLEFEAQLAIARQNVDELRQQLDLARTETDTVLASVKQLEADALQYRTDRNAAVDERDQLLAVSQRQQATAERLQADVHTLQSQLEVAIAAKVDAMVRSDEIEGREHSIEKRERHMEQDRDMMQTQIANLTELLHKSVKDNQAIRQENTMSRLQLETDLGHKTEELKQAVAQCSQYAESNQELTAQAEELTHKLKDQSNESTQMMQHYQKELQAKNNLVEIYKENSDDNAAEKQELIAAITELKKHLSDTTAQYGEMETRLRDIDVVHQQALGEKDERIEQLKDELVNANELLRVSNEENVEHVLEQMTPTAAAASRRLKSGMTLTEIFTMYVKTEQELQVKKRECTQNEIQLKSIVAELQEKAPEWKRQAIEYQNVVASNEELQAQLEKLIGEQVTMREEAAETGVRHAHAEREIRKMKASQSDLARQVCYLLKEIEQMRGGFTNDPDQSIGNDITANEMISRKLVTFGDIVELQDNNQKLLLLVRDLGGKLEELEEIQSSFNQSTYETRLAQFAKRIAELESSAESQARVVSNCTELKDRYKRLYFEIMQDVGRQAALDGSMEGQEAMDEDQNGTVHTRAANNSTTSNSAQTTAANAAKDTKITELEASLRESQKQLQQLRDEYVEYRKEKLANDKLSHEQFDQMRREVRELTATNCNLVSSVTFHTEQVKIQQKNMAVYKKQIQTLEERNRNYDKTIAKHEQTIAYLRDKTMTEQQRSSLAEIQTEEQGRQLRKMHEDVSRLTGERDALYRERHNQNILQNNLELIKTTFERSENDGRIRMEQRFDQAQRECSALRRRLQEEQDHFRELAADLKRQTDTATRKQAEEQQESERLRALVETLRAELETKSAHVNELSVKLQESLTPNQSDNPIARANKQIKELQLQCDQQAAELEHLRSDLTTTNDLLDKQTKTAGDWEMLNSELQQQYDQYKQSTTERVAALELSETNLKSRIDEQLAENRLQITGAQINNLDTTSALHSAQMELKDALQRCGQNARELRELRTECQQLKTALQSVEQKYSNEMILHSSDIQALSQCKDELNKIREQIDANSMECTIAVDALKTHKAELVRTAAERDAERAENEQRIRDLNAQNTLLHDQLQALNSKVSDSLNTSTNLNESTGMADSSQLNRSLTDDDHRSVSSDQLQTIIKYLRKEKDIAVSKVEILRAENVRLSTETSILQKRIAETNELAAERRSADATVVSSAKHSELLRKVETLNAITDSNRLLREERDSLAERTRDLTARLTKIEDDLFPLQEKNRELLAKTEEQASENQSLRRTAEQWHKRATSLVERSNKNPEDFKRLQTERENLAKMLTAEKESLRLVTVECATVKADKLRLETEAVNVRAQIATVAEERRRVGEELNAVRQAHLRLTTELAELRNECQAKDSSLTDKESQLVELKNKEMRVRSLAKKFKEAYLETKTKYEALLNGQPGAGGVTDAAAAEAGASGSTAAGTEDAANKTPAIGDVARIAELLAQIDVLREECETLRTENAAAKSHDDKAQQLNEASARIKLLTEAHGQISRDLQTLKAIHENCDQYRSEQELLMAGLKSQADGKIARLEKELSDLDTATKDSAARLQRDNETLTLRVNQLHRQLQTQGSKPATSSGPSEKSPSDAARTANVKPMAGPSSGQQSATVTPRRGGDTPLASIRPMSVQNSSRTAAVLPTSQTASPMVAAVQGSSSSSTTSSSSSTTTSSSSSVSAVAANASVVAVAAAASAQASAQIIPLIPPQQQVHTTGQAAGSNASSSVDAMSSSPTSSHTDYMPASSSAVIAAVPPMGSTSSSSSQSSSTSSTANTAESSQEAESMPNVSAAALGESITLAQQSASVAGSGQPQTVALVSPRVDVNVVQQSQQPVVASQALPVPAQSPPQPPHQTFDANQQQAAASTSGSSSGAVAAMPTASTSSSSTSSSTTSSTTPLVPACTQHQQASSSNTVTTTQAQAHKRPRDGEGETSTTVEHPGGSGVSSDANTTSPKNKRTRLAEQAFHQGISESGLDVEYQVPTSSQRDQEDDNVIVVDSDDDDEEDEMADDGIAEEQFEDEVDNAYGMEEEPYGMEQDDEADDGAGGNAADAAALAVNNEVDVEDSSDVPAQSQNSAIGGSSSSQASAVAASDVGTSDNAAELAQASGASGALATSGGGSGAAVLANDRQQFQTISSGSATREAATQQQQQQLQVLQQQQQSPGQQQQQLRPFEETDGIVPSTPILFPRGSGRSVGEVGGHHHGLSEAVSSPHPQVPQQAAAARFTFNNEATGSGAASVRTSTETDNSVEYEVVMDDTHVELNVEAISGERQQQPLMLLANLAEAGAEAEDVSGGVADGDDDDEDVDDESAAMDAEVAAAGADAVAGPSGSNAATSDAIVAEIIGAVPSAAATSADNENVNNGASTSEDVMDESFDESKQNTSIDDEIGTDGVTSEGEKVPSEEIQVEEGREAEATIQAPSSNTRSRTPRLKMVRGGGQGRGASSERPTPIVWDGVQNSSPGTASGSGTNSGRGAGGRGSRARRARR